MECPKCMQPSVLKDEDFLHLADGMLVIKQSFECTQCGFGFSRIGTKTVAGAPYGTRSGAQSPQREETIEFTNRI